jgi:putative transposase
MVSPQARREQVARLCHGGLLQRHACGLLGLARFGMSYTLRLPAKDAPVIEAMHRLSGQYPRYGYRRVRIFLAREGMTMSPGRAERLWRKAQLQVPQKRPRKRAASRPYPLPPLTANLVWAYDFVVDACANGQSLKCLTVVDEFTHGSLVIDVAGRIRSARVIDVLAKLIRLHGAPAFLRSDNGPEFVSNAILKWLTDPRIGTAYIDPGKPWQNGTAESFNGKFRDECQSVEWFRTRAEAKVVIEAWRRHYNTVRPHMSLNYFTPREFKSQHPPRVINPAVSQQ